ncbi:MAG: four helix bundle protein [Cyclobacteriaceae bacterium]|nr:four helix bundle protein [Cyclobacteriaceae bacterium]
MAAIERFEDIRSWQLARRLAHEIFLVTQREPVRYDFSLKDQINKSMGSIMDNIAEGFERDGNKEFIQFLFISKASAGEARSQWYRMFDRNYTSGAEYERIMAELNQISYLIKRLINYLKESEMKGSKFRNRD